MYVQHEWGWSMVEGADLYHADGVHYPTVYGVLYGAAQVPSGIQSCA